MSHIAGSSQFDGSSFLGADSNSAESGVQSFSLLTAGSSLENAIAAFDPNSSNYHGGSLQNMTQAAINVMVQQGVKEAGDSASSKKASARQSMAQKIG